MRIGLDIMGGDFAPKAPLEGVRLAYDELSDDIRFTLIGDSAAMESHAGADFLRQERIEVVHTNEVIDMGESPTKAISQKPGSSIVVGLKMLREGKIDVFMSAGNTGAVYVAALYNVKPVEGIMRPSITSIIPKENGGFGIILDVGANADCKPEVLLQFGLLGALYAKYVFGIEDPKVGLLNIGSEPEKGNLLTQAAYPLFENSTSFSFVGNVEGYDFFNDRADVIVCDGFTGNVVLKTAETIYQIMKKRGISDDYFKRYDYEDYGGTPILGVNKPVIIGHGVSSAHAFVNMIKMGIQVAESKLIEKIKLAFEFEHQNG